MGCEVADDKRHEAASRRRLGVIKMMRSRSGRKQDVGETQYSNEDEEFVVAVVIGTKNNEEEV